MDARLEAWAASGAMALTGRADGAPLGPPSPLVDGVAELGAALARASGAIGDRVDVDALALLGERAAVAGLGRQGSTSCGGGTRLIEAADGVVAVALARDEDRILVPAWLELPGPMADDDEAVWAAIESSARGVTVAWLEARAALVGLAVAGCPRADDLGTPAAPPPGPWPIAVEPFGRTAPRVDAHRFLVVDLSALWAGPLCGQLLGAAGARVVKVESIGRPDGARAGPGAFFDLLNAGKQSVALDLADAVGRAQLHRLLGVADVVIESSRPRALRQLGIDAPALLARADGPSVWVSITGYGRRGAAGDRIAYGDVAAAAGGLLVDDADGWCFCADAIADPLTGLVAAVGALDALASGTRRLLDIAMVDVAARWAGPQLAEPTSEPLAVAPPRARASRGRAPELGRDTDAVLAEVAG